jgi:hypothetical protein
MSDEDVIKKLQTQRRVLPQSELDLALMTTNSVWGQPEINPELRERLNKIYTATDQEGKTEIAISSLWGLLGFYTRDLRLANLSSITGELLYCQYFLDLANDMLQAGMIDAFIICLSRVATQIELSQSKGGFLRKKMSTFTTEHITGEKEPPKKSLFGIRKKEGNK